MSNQSDDSEKQYEPTQKKLDDARKRGEIAKSTDLITASAYVGFTISLAMFGATSAIAAGSALMILLAEADDLANTAFADTGHPLIRTVLIEMSQGLAPWFLIPAACAVLAVTAQRAWIFAPTKIAPKLDRVSPISGFKNKFGRQGLFEFIKSAIKLTIYCVVLGFFLSGQSETITGSLHLQPALIMTALGWMLVQLMMIVVVISAALGAIDFIFQRAEHIRKNKMSRKEMTEEQKQAEGDPMMKQQRRQRAQEIAMNKMLSDVPSANVVVVNPTHYAVALSWDQSSGRAPICVAKGVDEIAARIREQAHEHAVPIHSDPPTARALHASTEIGQEIAPEHYRPVAAAIRFAEQIRQKARN